MVLVFVFFFHGEDVILGAHWLLEFRRVLFRSFVLVCDGCRGKNQATFSNQNEAATPDTPVSALSSQAPTANVSARPCPDHNHGQPRPHTTRSEERREGKESVNMCLSRWWPNH